MKSAILAAVAAVCSCVNGCSEVAMAQRAAAVQNVAAPVLSTTETIALQAVAEKLQANRAEGAKLMQAVQQIERDIATEHPGYHLDEASGTIVKDGAGVTARK